MASRRPEFALIACAVILVAAALLRFASLGEKPIHADESVHAWKVGEMQASGGHRYDPAEYHGPTLHYLGAAVAWISGERSLPSLEIGTLRVIPAAAGVLVVLFTALLAPAIGARAALLAAVFAAVSPLLVYYSRQFIQEQLVVLFTVATFVFFVRWIRHRSLWNAALAGLSFGLLLATKETWVLLAGAAGAGLIAAFPPGGRLSREALAAGWFRQGIGVFIGTVAFVVVAFYTSFFTDFAALPDFWRGLVVGAGRSAGSVHDKAWYAYAAPLLWERSGGRVWTEAGIAAFALAGLGSAFASRGANAGHAAAVRFFAVFTGALAAAYVVIPYKIIWLACGFWHGAAILAGVGAARLTSGKIPHGLRLLSSVAAGAVILNLTLQAWRAAVPLAARPGNPYAYVTTSTDIDRLRPRLEAIARQHPAGPEMTIKVALPEYWPLPWLLRDFPRAGFWLERPDDWNADVLLVSPELFEAIPEAQRAGLATEFFGLRDGVLVILAAERDLWESSLPGNE